MRVVTGLAGTGKSAVLAWLCALSDPQLRAEIATARPDAFADAAAVPGAGRVSAAVWARALDARGAAGALAAALTLPVAADAAVEDVLAAVGDLDPAERGGLVVVLDALDEARAPRDIARQLLVPLARDLGVKVLVGTRPGRDEELLAAFGERAVIYRLDDPAWFDRHDLAEYAAACLRADFDPDLASGYRTDPAACRQVAAAIAEAAGSNFLVAGLAARTRADEPVIDVSAPGWRGAQRFPGEVGQAFDDYLARFGDNETRARDLLRALAYAEGPGLPADELWAGMATALAAPRRYGIDDLAWLLDSAASYLVESGGEHGQPVYRIFHQALIEHLRPEKKETQRQRELVEALMRAVPSGAAGPDWAHAPSYIRSHLAAHAATAGQLDDLLEDPNYLLTIDPARLVPHLDAARSGPARAAAAVYRQSAHLLARLDPPMRASQLELTAHHLGYRSLAARIAGAAPDRPWQTRWSHGHRAAGHQVLTGHTGGVGAVAVGALPDGTPVIVSGDGDGTVRVWRLADGAPVGEPLRGHDSPVNAVAVGALPDGTPVIVSGGSYGDNTLRVWRLADGTPVGEPLRGHDGAVNAVAVGALPDGTPVIVSGGGDGTVRVWRLADGAPVGEPLRGHAGWVNAVAVGALPDGTPVIVSGGATARCGCGGWPTAPRSGSRCAATTAGCTAVAAGALPDGTPVIVSGGERWHGAGVAAGRRHPGRGAAARPRGAVSAVAVGALPDGTPVIVSGGRRQHGAGVAAGRRHPGRGAAARPRRRGGRGGGRGAAGRHPGHRQRRPRRYGAGVAAGRRHPGRGAAARPRRRGERGGGRGAAGRHPGHRQRRPRRHGAGVAAGRRHPGRGAAARPRWLGERGGGRGAAGRHPGHRQRRRRRHGAGVAAGRRRPGRGAAARPRRRGDAVAVGALPDGTPVIISGGGRHGAGVAAGRRHPGRGAADAATTAGGRGGGRGAAGRHPGHRQRRRRRHGAGVAAGRRRPGRGAAAGHDGSVNAVAVGALPDGTPVIVSGGGDGTVRVWRLADGTPVGEPLAGHPGAVWAVAAGALPDGTPVIISGGGDGTVRVWRLADGTPVAPPLDLPEPVRAVAVHGNVIITAAGADIAVHQPALPRPMR